MSPVRRELRLCLSLLAVSILFIALLQQCGWPLAAYGQEKTGYVFEAFLEPHTSTSWDGDAKAASGTIDLQSVFNMASGLSAVAVNIRAVDETVGVTFGLGPSSSYPSACWQRVQVASKYVGISCIVPVGVGDDIYFYEDGELDGVYLEIYGYFLPPLPTLAPVPTDTVVPTHTLMPTHTLVPTHTPRPTSTGTITPTATITGSGGAMIGQTVLTFTLPSSYTLARSYVITSGDYMVGGLVGVLIILYALSLVLQARRGRV